MYILFYFDLYSKIMKELTYLDNWKTGQMNTKLHSYHQIFCFLVVKSEVTMGRKSTVNLNLKIKRSHGPAENKC